MNILCACGRWDIHFVQRPKDGELFDCTHCGLECVYQSNINSIKTVNVKLVPHIRPTYKGERIVGPKAY
jgi:predicted small metal-binding protein